MATPAKDIVNHLLNMLESYLQSHENLTLDSSFKVQFKVIGVSHVTHRMINDPNYVVHIHKTEKPGNPKGKKNYPHFIFSFSTFCYEHLKECFVDLCFFLCLILSLAKYDYNTKKNNSNGKARVFYWHIKSIRKQSTA